MAVPADRTPDRAREEAPLLPRALGWREGSVMAWRVQVREDLLVAAWCLSDVRPSAVKIQP